ncbi:hypothetical protein KQX54_000504 [Cotesia glomerata]|uniref:Uncharacterized protein n=1 Tax=Cotesia glomerata TaxID=32391 RepID=A0AAV7I8J0_COTGL|nr:hypothetical protein KQX54_000504 [Cotesia glomerata]
MNQFKLVPVTDKLNKQSEKCVENAKQRLFIQGTSLSNVYPAGQFNINFNRVNYMNNIDLNNALSFSHSLVEPSDGDPLIDELFSSNLESFLRSRLEKDCNTPISQVSSKPKSNKKTSAVVRP